MGRSLTPTQAEHVRAHLRRLAEAEGSVLAAARRLGISQPALHNIVREPPKGDPSYPTAVKLAGLMGVPVEALMGEGADARPGAADLGNLRRAIDGLGTRIDASTLAAVEYAAGFLHDYPVPMWTAILLEEQAARDRGR